MTAGAVPPAGRASDPGAAVHVISLGGTIAMTADADGAVQPTLAAGALLASLPAARGVARISAETARVVPGASLRIDDLLDVARRIRDAAANGVRGVVVVQGTDTLEESAFVVDLLHNGETTVVFTGAMRAPEQPGADGPANLLSAIRTAASAEARDLGVLVCMNGELHAAPLVRKTNTVSPAAFTSPGAGPVGLVVEDRVIMRLRPRPMPRLDLDAASAGAPVPVALHRVALDDDVRVLDHLVEVGYEGLVLEAFGAGHVAEWMVPAIERIAARIPVVLVSRTGAGYLLRSTYGFAGSERDLFHRGLIDGGGFDGLKARLLLCLALRAGVPRGDLSTLFQQTSPWS